MIIYVRALLFMYMINYVMYYYIVELDKGTDSESLCNTHKNGLWGILFLREKTNLINRATDGHSNWEKDWTSR